MTAGARYTILFLSCMTSKGKLLNVVDLQFQNDNNNNNNKNNKDLQILFRKLTPMNKWRYDGEYPAKRLEEEERKKLLCHSQHPKAALGTESFVLEINYNRPSAHFQKIWGSYRAQMIEGLDHVLPHLLGPFSPPTNTYQRPTTHQACATYWHRAVNQARKEPWLNLGTPFCRASVNLESSGTVNLASFQFLLLYGLQFPWRPSGRRGLAETAREGFPTQPGGYL